MADYSKLFKIMDKKEINKTNLVNDLGISSRTVAKLSKGQNVSLNTLEKIADFLGVAVSDIFQDENNKKVLKSESKVFKLLQQEKNSKLKGGLYHEIQVRLTYNSNRIEGSQLSEDQTRYIYETNTIGVSDNKTVNIDDIIETINHFKAIDYMIDNCEVVLNEKIIKETHAILKANTSDSKKEWFAIGDYKLKSNTVGGIETTKPKQVKSAIVELLENYNKKESKSLEDIIEFHYKFESIHPFQDGNGRVGRLIMFKECLANNIIPFIIEDDMKLFYYRGLKEWKNEKGYLIDTCLMAQDKFKKLLELFE